MGGRRVQGRGTRAAHAQRQAAARAGLGDDGGGGGGGGTECVSSSPGTAGPGPVRPRPRPAARHGQRGQPGGRRWRRAAAARGLRPRPRRGEAAFSTGWWRTAPGVRRGAGNRRTTRSRPRARCRPGHVSAGHGGARGAGICSLRPRPRPGPTTLRSSLDSEVGRPATLRTQLVWHERVVAGSGPPFTAALP